MVKGLGNDIIEVSRIRQSLERHGQRFLDKVLTAKEQEYCLKYKDSAPHLAGRFSAKEAIAKALGTGFGRSLSFLDIEILNDKLGSPQVALSSRAQKRFGEPRLLLSISHCHAYASAVALWLA